MRPVPAHRARPCPARWSCTSSCALTRWLTEEREMNPALRAMSRMKRRTALATIAAMTALVVAAWVATPPGANDWRANRPGDLRHVVRSRRAETVRARRRAAALLLVHRGGEGVHRGHAGRSRLRDRLLGPRHESVDPDLGAAAAGGPEARVGRRREGEGGKREDAARA